MKKELPEMLIRCPRLGDEMSFSYCLKESGSLPCSRIVQCWSPFIDVEGFLKKTLPSEQWTMFVNSQPKDKMTSLIEIIEAAKAKK